MKTALCIQRHRLAMSSVMSRPYTAAIPVGFFDNPTVLANRTQCETDESLLQLLPYIHVFDRFGRVLVYARGAAGAEARLHGKLSIGLGGHVDSLVPDATDLHAHLQNEAARECEEETGVKIEPGLFTFDALIIDRTNPVGRVHLGIRTRVRIDSQLLIETEKDVIENGRWMTPDEIAADRSVFDRLEPWSRACFPSIA